MFKALSLMFQSIGNGFASIGAGFAAIFGLNYKLPVRKYGSFKTDAEKLEQDCKKVMEDFHHHGWKEWNKGDYESDEKEDE